MVLGQIASGDHRYFVMNFNEDRVYLREFNIYVVFSFVFLIIAIMMLITKQSFKPMKVITLFNCSILLSMVIISLIYLFNIDSFFPQKPMAYFTSTYELMSDTEFYIEYFIFQGLHVYASLLIGIILAVLIRPKIPFYPFT